VDHDCAWLVVNLLDEVADVGRHLEVVVEQEDDCVDSPTPGLFVPEKIPFSEKESWPPTANPAYPRPK
jgi:hypothetical protein